MLTAAKTHTPSTASAILPLVLVFLCGVSVGALVMSMGIHRSLHSVTFNPKTPNTITIERWKHELDLTDDQAAQIVQILDDFSKYYDNVLADGNTRIMQILNAKQQAKFQQMLKDRR
jgi:Spy/CpxP family protein refolding chaperone